MNPTSINLLPTALRRRLTIRRGLRQWAVRWGVVGLLTLGCWAVVWSETRKLHAEVDAAEQDSGGIRRLKTIGESFDDRINALHTRRDALLAAADNRTALATLAVVGRAAKAAGGTLQIDDYNYRETPVATNGGPQPDAQRITLSLSGVAENNLAVGRFVVALRKSGVFASVDLKSSRDTGGGTEHRRHYRLQCVFIHKAISAGTR